MLNLDVHHGTVIHMPEPVSSVMLGDPTLFKVEHSEKEPRLVVVKARTTELAQSNLLIGTIGGSLVTFLLKTSLRTANGEVNPSQKVPSTIHFLIRYRPIRSFLIEELTHSSALIAPTDTLTANVRDDSSSMAVHERTSDSRAELLDELLAQQRRSILPPLEGNDLRVGISGITEAERQLLVRFSVVNHSSEPIELMAPQVQLSGTARSGRLLRRDRSTASDQLLVAAFRLMPRKLGPQERSDGVVVFEKPSFKQSNETLYLQIAEAGAVDRPVVVPIRLKMAWVMKGAF